MMAEFVELSRSSCEPKLFFPNADLRSTSRCFRSMACCIKSAISS